MRGVLRAARGTSELARAVRRARRGHGGSPLAIAARARRVRRRQGFDYPEALRAGLLDPLADEAWVAGHVSRHRMLDVQRRANPEALGALSGDKGVFYRYAAAVGIPTPELFGIFGVGIGWRPGGRALADATDLAELLGSARLPETLVVKPVDGYHGRGVRVLRRHDVDPRRLAAELAGDPEFEGWVIQERLRDHPATARLSAGDTLQTARIVTLVGRDGEVAVLSGDFRVAIGDGPTDNFRSGRSGNGQAGVRLEDGVLGALRLPRPDGCGLVETAETPAGVRVEGVALPHWPAAVAMVRAAALHLLPARTIGWDVALTANGPVVVEANMFYWPRTSPDQGLLAARIDGG